MAQIGETDELPADTFPKLLIHHAGRREGRIAMREKDLPVTYIVFPDEGHGFARPENRLDANARIEQCLAEQLGGRAEPVTAIEGSTAEKR